jgi:hypothetical protein
MFQNAELKIHHSCTSVPGPLKRISLPEGGIHRTKSQEHDKGFLAVAYMQDVMDALSARNGRRVLFVMRQNVSFRRQGCL